MKYYETAQHSFHILVHRSQVGKADIDAQYLQNRSFEHQDLWRPAPYPTPILIKSALSSVPIQGHPSTHETPGWYGQSSPD